MSVWSVTSAPAAEPLLRADIKNYLKVPAAVTTDDDLIDALILEARQFAERVTSRALITQTITEYWDSFPTDKDKDPRIILPSVAPVQSVTSVSYVASTASSLAYTVLSDTKYTVDSVSGLTVFGPSRIYLNPGESWPALANYYNMVKAVYVAGYGVSGASVPGPILTAMRRLIGAWYYGRKGSFKDDWEMVADLLNPYKVHK